MRKNRVKPTSKQQAAFEHMKKAKTLQEAMMSAGYSEKTSTHPKQNFVDTAGFEVLINQYRDDLKRAGINSEVMARIQAAGLFDEDPKIKLEYLKETKKDFGLFQADSKSNDTFIGFNLVKKQYEW